MKAIQVKENGGPEKLQLVEIPKPTPGPGQALVRIAASGVNFIDVYFRIGLYKADLPLTPGSEAAGTVEAVGPGVTEVAPGDRVAYAMARGSYAEYAVVPASLLVPIPDGVDFETAAAAMLQGMTAHYLTHSTYPLKQGDTCLVHAAAGGAGGLMVQMAKMLGARVFGTVSTEEKARIAREHGADEAILYTQQDFEAEVKRLTGGRGVDVVYDSVGKTDLRQKPQFAAPARHDGAVRPIERAGAAVRPEHSERQGLAVSDAAQPGALRADARGTALARGRRACGWMAEGKLKLRIDRAYPLAEAAARTAIWKAARRPANCC